MTVGILLVSHNNIGTELINTARQMLSCCPLPTKVLSIESKDRPEAIRLELDEDLKGLDQGNGILILTDMFGSTPSNIACAVSDRTDIRVVSGLNLPMLIRVLNYPALSLDELEVKALSGGQEGVVRCHHSGYSSK
ncbi:PTS mannose transporter subunit IIA [Methylophaga sp.]|jgi:PTS system ascorbate-specific IIA component|uniref:PTS sugar transporter subunit IIA n=1 Tax=Methylophaga sp. TaxID=2024840 RepID=UPI001400D203|nr:PTS mannose transporter subunit IIA [Methylophaga sp.]MTI64214.1 PTS mannose transporter subunit IIA [Methylophaga sp.]